MFGREPSVGNVLNTEKIRPELLVYYNTLLYTRAVTAVCVADEPGRCTSPLRAHTVVVVAVVSSCHHYCGVVIDDDAEGSLRPFRGRSHHRLGEDSKHIAGFLWAFYTPGYCAL